MEEIKFILKNSELFENLVAFEDYREDVLSNIAFNPEYIEYSDTCHFSSIDLIICEDNYDTINQLIEGAQKSHFIENVVIFEDIEIFELYLIKNVPNSEYIPKILTLDFMYNSINTVHDNIIKKTNETYLKVKKKWTSVAVVGISNFKAEREIQPSIDSLMKLFESNGDAVYDKVSLFPILYQILDNEIISQNANNLKSIGASLNKTKHTLIDEFNSLILKESVNYGNEKIYDRIYKYLDVQEVIVTHASINGIRLKKESLAAAMLFYEREELISIDSSMLKDLYNMNGATKNDVCKKYNIPKQPLPAINKYFILKNEEKLFTKEAKIIFSILKKESHKWPKTIELAKNRLINDSNKVVTFLDDFIEYVTL